MPSFDIIRKNTRKSTFRTQSIIDRYELNTDSENLELSGKIDIEDKDWSIGLIVGSSGSGKSTISRELFGSDYFVERSYSKEFAIIDEMPKDKTLDQITEIFNSCGLGTIWSWLKPYEVLSTGEKMRCDLARCLLEDRDLVVFDEFTSVVDREIAKVASACISKAVRKAKKQFVAVSCHRDIVDWLEPDWIYDTDKKRFFFALGYTSGHKLTSRFVKQIESCGDTFKSITI